MKIAHEPDDDGGEFFVVDKGDRIAELTYARTATLLTIRHTEVDQDLEGRGLGKQLVGEAVRFARESGLKVAATCSFAHALLAKVPAFADVRADEG